MAKPRASDIRRIPWAKSYLWNIRFEDRYDEQPGNTQGGPRIPSVPAPFKEFFPAHTVQEPLFDVESGTASLALLNFRYPYRVVPATLAITVWDTQSGILRDWMWRWSMAHNLPEGIFVRPLNDVVLPLVVQRLDDAREVLYERKYWVFPESRSFIDWNSESTALGYPLYFTVVSGMFQNPSVRTVQYERAGEAS